MKNIPGNKWLLWFCGITFAAKLILLFFFVNDFTLLEDHDIAVNIVSSGEFKYYHNGQWNYNFQFPVYPCIVSCIYFVFGVNAKAVIVYHLLLQVVTGYFLFHVFLRLLELFNIGRIKTYHASIALISTACFLFHPLISYYALSGVFPFTQNLFFIAASFFFMFRLFDSWNLKNFLFYASCIGFAVIDRSTAVTVTVPCLFLSFYYFPLKSAFKKITAVALVAVIPLCVWISANYFRTGHVQLTSCTGENLWLGIQEETEGTTQFADGRSYHLLFTSADVKELFERDAALQNEYFMEKYFSECRQDPGRVTKMFFVKMKNFWWFRSWMGLSYPKAVRSFIPLYKIAYASTLLFAVAGIFISGRKSFCLWSYLLALSVIQSLVYVEMRHRIIIEPWLIFFAVIAASYIFFATKKRELPSGA